MAASSIPAQSNDKDPKRLLRFQSHEHLRQRLIHATLSGRTIRVDAIRSAAANPGLNDSEISFLRLLEKCTNGSIIEISYTGTSLLYKPGQVLGGSIKHDCQVSEGHGIGWYLEPLLPIAAFGKKDLNLTLTGITTTNTDYGVDVLRTAILPTMKKFLGDSESALELRILKRGAAPLGGGEIQFICPSVRSYPTIHLINAPTPINRIRGIASSTRVSPANVNRVVSSVRGIVNPYVSDVHIYTDVRRGDECGLSPGFAVSLIAESPTGQVYSSEVVANAGETPEDIGELAAKNLLLSIVDNSTVSREAREMILSAMVCASEDVGRARFGAGAIDERFVTALREIELFYGKRAAIKEVTDEQGSGIEVALVGIGYLNTNKGVA